MQFLADIIKKLNEENVIKKEDLYNFKEAEIIELIEKSKYNNVYNIWKNAEKVKISKERPNNVYYVHHGAKIRYINPIVNGIRISKICKISDEMIKKNLSYDMNKYVYLDFDF